MEIIQSILLDKNIWKKDKAIKWIKMNKFKHKKIDVTQNYYRFRQSNPNKFSKFRIKNIKNGIKLVLGFL